MTITFHLLTCGLDLFTRLHMTFIFMSSCKSNPQFPKLQEKDFPTKIHTFLIKFVM